MRFRLIEHAKERSVERGARTNEIAAVISHGIEISAKKGRKAKEMVVSMSGEWREI